MFLAKSLRERLKKTYLENDSDTLRKESSQHQTPSLNLKALLNFKGLDLGLPPYPHEEMSSQQLKALDKNEWKSHFTLDRLKQQWETRVPLEFPHHHKKFSDDIISPQTKESKEFVRNLIDNDILELKQKEWNNSTDVYGKVKPDFAKTIFEVNHGLKDFKIVPLKERACPEGCDSRNSFEINGNKWEVSNQIELRNKNATCNELNQKANENSLRYWKDNEINRQFKNEFPISEDRKKIEKIRYFKQYRTPLQKYKDYYKMMNKAKELSKDDYISVQHDVLYNNPGCKYPEKINALINKRMFNIYKNKYNELTGKFTKEQPNHKFHWNDCDLSQKIISLDSINDISWFKPKYLTKKNKSNSCSQLLRKEMLKNLVIKGNDIHKKEEEIKEQKEEEIKKQKNKEWLHKYKLHSSTSRLKGNKSTIMISKYPIDKQLYESLPLLQHSYSLRDLSNESRDGQVIENKTALIKCNSDSKREEQSEGIKVFLEAYKDITQQEVDRKSASYKKERSDKTYKYNHPGIYRLFEYNENVDVHNENTNDNNKEDENKHKHNARYKFWSCCMNEDYLSRGCQKIGTTKNKSYQNL